MKKIVHIFWGLTFGGIETMLVNIANAQVNKGANVYIIIINDLYEKTIVQTFNPQIHLIFLHRKLRSHNLWFIIKMNRALKHINPDVIHLHKSEFYKFILGRKLNRKACLTLHDLPTGLIKRGGILGFCFPFLDHLVPGNVKHIDKVSKVFTISQAVKDALLNDYGVDSTVVNNGIVTAYFKQKRAESSTELFKIVQVSRLEHDKKGQDLLIKAVAKLEGNIEIDFIGTGSSMDYLKQLVKELKVEKYVHFLGKQTQSYIAEHLCDYNLFVQASRWEGFGLTVAEAMAAKVPVLVSADQGPAEITCGNKYGWVFKNGNIDDLAKQIDFIRTNYNQASLKIQDAYQHVIDNYDVAVTAKKYLELY